MSVSRQSTTTTRGDVRSARANPSLPLAASRSPAGRSIRRRGARADGFEPIQALVRGEAVEAIAARFGVGIAHTLPGKFHRIDVEMVHHLVHTAGAPLDVTIHRP